MGMKMIAFICEWGNITLSFAVLVARSESKVALASDDLTPSTTDGMNRARVGSMGDEGASEKMSKACKARAPAPYPTTLPTVEVCNFLATSSDFATGRLMRF